MDMGTTTASGGVRRACTALFATILGGAATLATVTPAHAATSGALLTKGTGSYYSATGYVHLSAARGVVKTYSFKVVNTGSAAQRLRVTLGASAPLSAKLYRGLTLISSGTYLTPLIAPSGSVALSVKASVPSGTPQSSYFAGLQLTDPATNTLLDTAYAVLHVAAPAKGTRRNDLFLKTGSQPSIGGSVSYQYLSASAIKPGSTATFALRLQNDGAARSAITLDGGRSSCPQMTVTVKLGTTNVTAAVRAGTWSTGVLAPGAKKDLTVSIKLVSATACAEGSTYFQAMGPDAPVINYAHVPVGL